MQLCDLIFREFYSAVLEIAVPRKGLFWCEKQWPAHWVDRLTGGIRYAALKFEFQTILLSSYRDSSAKKGPFLV